MRHFPLIIGCAFGLLLSSLGLAAEPVTITVRVVDARNGNPYEKLHLRIFLYKTMPNPPQGYRTDAEARANLIATKLETTNDRGEVTFELPIPPPGVIEVFSGPMACGTEFFDARAVIANGAIGENHCKTKWTKRKISFRVKPGEIIYFATHVGFFEGALTK